MADFRDELLAWLAQYPDVEFRPRRPQPTYQFGWEPLDNSLERIRHDREATRDQMSTCMREIAQAVANDPEAWIGDDQEQDGFVILGNYGWEPNSKDGFEPDGGAIQLATTNAERLVVLEAVLDGKVCFVGEYQTGGPSWVLEKQWGPTAWSRPRMPRTIHRIEQLTSEILAFIAAESANPSGGDKD